jgi:hypothetical protein
MAAQITVRNLNAGEGAYRIAAISGLLTGVAAASASAGHLFAMRWAPTTAAGATTVEKRRFARLQRLRARWFTSAGFTTAQDVGMDLSVLRGYTGAHSGGVAMTLTGDAQKKRASFPSSAVASMRIGNTGALTAGTHTFDAQPVAQGYFAELAAAATVPKGMFELFLSTEDLDRDPIVLAPNEGICIRNSILMGAGGTARLVVELEWAEIERY